MLSVLYAKVAYRYAIAEISTAKLIFSKKQIANKFSGNEVSFVGMIWKKKRICARGSSPSESCRDPKHV